MSSWSLAVARLLSAGNFRGSGTLRAGRPTACKIRTKPAWISPVVRTSRGRRRGIGETEKAGGIEVGQDLAARVAHRHQGDPVHR